MAEGQACEAWGRRSVLLALTANCHRGPKKHRALKPSDYNPFGRAPSEVLEVNRGCISILKDAFLGNGLKRC